MTLLALFEFRAIANLFHFEGRIIFLTSYKNHQMATHIIFKKKEKKQTTPDIHSRQQWDNFSDTQQ